MAAPSKRFDELFYERKLLHDGNPVMRWMIANTVAKMDPAGNRKPDKEKSTGKIDGVVGAIMALGRMMVTKDSVYASRGLQKL
jgi:phage terminase large subunit-like protein